MTIAASQSDRQAAIARLSRATWSKSTLPAGPQGRGRYGGAPHRPPRRYRGRPRPPAEVGSRLLARAQRRIAAARQPQKKPRARAGPGESPAGHFPGDWESPKADMVNGKLTADLLARDLRRPSAAGQRGSPPVDFVRLAVALLWRANC
jgi:hypothetical protein